MRKPVVCSILAFLVLVLGCGAWAQSGGVAAVSGVVRDASGAAIAKANVTISSDSRGVVRTLTTNEAGAFTAPSLVPGPGYKISVSAQGFAPYEATSLELAVGQNMALDVVLKVAAATEKVEVTGEAPLVETTKTDTSAVVSQQQIENLPINGRRVDSFVLLTPAVSNDYVYGLLTFRGVAGQNTFLVDGVDTTEGFYNENAGRTRIASQISQDAVDQFQVVSSNYSAEFGHAMGGVVNTVTKSGANQMHGSAYWFYRSTGFNAKDHFASFNPSEKRNQLGAEIGGPIKKDKLFYYANFETTRRNFPMLDSLNTNAVSGATQTWNQCGVASGGFPAATAAQCTAINGLLPRFFGSIDRKLDQELYFAKLDYRLSDRNSLSASFNFLHAVSPNGIQTGAVSTTGSALNSNGNDFATVKNGRLQWVAVPTSTLSNEFRFGLATDRQADSNNPALLGQGLGQIALSVYGTNIGATNYLPRVEPNERRFQFTDNVTWVKGTHTLKFGADVDTTHDYVYYVSNFNGSYTYQTVNAFALDYSGNTTGTKHWQTYAQTFGTPDIAFTQNDWAFYAQDQWRATNRLVLTAGARYEYTQMPQPGTCNPDYPLTCHINAPTFDLAPRVGATFQLTPKTVIQAGYGIFYARFQGGSIDNLFTTGNGKYQTSVSLASTQAAQLAAGPSFPNILTSIPTAAKVSAANLQMVAPGLRTPYSEQANIGIQREIVKDTVLDVNYLWSRGVQLYGIRDLNLPTTSTNYTYKIVDASGNQTGTYTTPVVTGSRPDSRYGMIAYAENGVNSYYNALAVQLNHRFSHGFTAMASYTWSHEIDDGQQYAQGANNLFLNNPYYWLNNGNYRDDMGSGNLDQRHRFVLSWLWAPKFTSRTDAVSRYLVNGWQLSAITTLATGHPNGSQTVYVSDKPVTGMFSNFSLNGTGFSGRVPWLPVNSYYLPSFDRADMRLAKVIPIDADGRKSLTLNFDMFNVGNNWSATGYTSSQAYYESKGVIQATPTKLYIPSGDALAPDGTQARRMQVSARFSF